LVRQFFAGERGVGAEVVGFSLKTVRQIVMVAFARGASRWKPWAN